MRSIRSQENIKAKHKFATVDLAAGDPITMYGVLVGKAQEPIAKGGLISTTNVKHATNDFTIGERHTEWVMPDVICIYRNRTFNGYHRADGSVGTANYWVVIPMVFCENRNLDVLQQALVTDLGYGRNRSYQLQSQQLIELVQDGEERGGDPGDRSACRLWCSMRISGCSRMWTASSS